jgi:hypothetical protein
MRPNEPVSAVPTKLVVHFADGDPLSPREASSGDGASVLLDSSGASEAPASATAPLSLCGVPTASGAPCDPPHAAQIASAVDVQAKGAYFVIFEGWQGGMFAERSFDREFRAKFGNGARATLFCNRAREERHLIHHAEIAQERLGLVIPGAGPPSRLPGSGLRIARDRVGLRREQEHLAH